MANIKRFVVQIKNSEPKFEDYIWEFDTPPRSKIGEHEKQHQQSKLFEVKTGSGLHVNGNNHGEFTLTSKKLTYAFSIFQESGFSNSLEKCEIKFYSNEKLLSSQKSIFTSEHQWLTDRRTFKGEFEDLKCEYWNDRVDRIRLYFTVKRVEIGRIITSVEDATPNLGTDTSKNGSLTTPTLWTSTEFFLSKEHSDCMFVCEGEEFPAHKVLLSIASRVFSRMLSPSNEMTESKEGKIEITDMKPDILKEMLRFIYYGWVSNLRDVADLLILPADKYDIPKLKQLCETSLLRQLTPQTALTLYSLAESVEAKTLMTSSLEYIKLNKSKVFLNSEELIEFTLQYPEVMVQVLKV